LQQLPRIGVLFILLIPRSVRLPGSYTTLHEYGKLFGQLKQVNNVFRITAHNLLSTDVTQVIIQNFLTQNLDQELDIFSHVLFSLCFFKVAEAVVGESILKELDIELVTGEHLNVVDRLINAKVCQALISELQNFLNN
jgi:hypothetical protein